MKHRFLILTLYFLSLGWTSDAQVQQKLPDKSRILFLLDGSGSMLARWGNDLRIREAKRILSDLVDSLRVNENLELALRVYGHQYDRRERNCEDTRLEAGFNANNHDYIIGKLKDIKPKGTTPIAYSLEQAANDFPLDDGYRNIVIIITDGIESCDGDPCAVSLALQQRGIFLKPFVIGLGMNELARDPYECVGEYFDARDTRDFQKVLNRAIRQSLDKTTVSVELLDQNSNPRETDVNVTFYNDFTKTPAYEFVHYRDRNGKPDSVEIDAVISYDVVVNTIPPVVRRGVRLTGGEHNVIRIKSPQGALRVRQPNHTEYRDGVKVLVYQKDQPQILNVQPIEAREKYLVGSYDVEVLTLPRTRLNDVSIQQSETTTLEVSPPGLLNIISHTEGVGSIYLVSGSEREIWTQNMPSNRSKWTVTMQPGTYKLVFRAHTAQGSKFTRVKNFTIRSNNATTVDLLN